MDNFTKKLPGLELLESDLAQIPAEPTKPENTGGVKVGMLAMDIKPGESIVDFANRMVAEFQKQGLSLGQARLLVLQVVTELAKDPVLRQKFKEARGDQEDDNDD